MELVSIDAAISATLRCPCNLLRVRRQVEHILGKVINQTCSDVLVAHTACDLSRRIHDRNMAIAALIHQQQHLSDRVLCAHADRIRGHMPRNRLSQDCIMTEY